MSPRIDLIVEVLPTPLRPSRAVTPEAGTSNETSSTTCWPGDAAVQALDDEDGLAHTDSPR